MLHAVIDHVLPWLAPGGAVFCATLLAAGLPRNAAARHLRGFYDEKSIFSNETDDAHGLHAAPNLRFVQVEMRIVGCGAPLVASKPRPRR